MKFEKVGFAAFYKDMKRHFWKIDDKEINAAYDHIEKPERKTKYSAGYDLHSPIKTVLTPGQVLVLPTGIKAYFAPQEAVGWHLKIYDRSSVGIKSRVWLPNSVGVIDADYYNNEDNEGDIMIALYNGGSQTFNIDVGDRVSQAVFEIYGVTSDDRASGARTGGVGSTGKS